MPSTFPCPNPVCAQVFNADAVQGASSLVCPRCGTKFEFRPQAAARPAGPAKVAAPKRPPVPPRAAAPAKPAAPPRLPAKTAAPPPVPIARPVAARAAQPAKPPIAKPAVPMASPVAPMAVPLAAPASSSLLSFNSTPDVVLAPRRRRALPGWLVATLVIVPVFGGVLGLVVWAINAGYTRWNFATPGTPAVEDQDKGFVAQGNFHMNPPGKPWKQDTGIQAQMRVDLAYRRSGPSSVAALAFKDYQKRLPRDAELIDEALGKVRSYLGGVEYEVKPKGDGLKLGGQPAIGLEFTGEDPEHVLVEGEVVATAYRGVGYWYFSWGPQDQHDDLTAEWASLRLGFTLGNKREDWTEAPRKTLTVVGNKLPYKLDYAEEVWQKQELDGYDKAADAVLLGHDPKDKDVQTVSLMARAQVLALDKAADLPAAVKLARDYLSELEKEKTADDQYTYAGATMEVVTDKSIPNADADVKIGAFQGHVVKFQVKKTADLQKYAVLAVVRQEGGVLAVVCECSWDRREYWDQEFTPLLDKLRPAKGK